MEDVRIRLGGGDIRLRPAYGLYRELEARQEMPVPELLRAHTLGALKLRELGLIVYLAAREAGEEVEPEAVEKRLFEAGTAGPAVREPVGVLLSTLLWAPDWAKKNSVEWLARERKRAAISISSSRPPTDSDGRPPSYGPPPRADSGTP